ncbi:MAG: hypothetical protein A2Y77_08905 [Planctomycetes bacterium RBG_13_62_9]|nr:MAG: hypothetical protein A2Y77_08905 [Planctomycetes bacterium RBG_13_62_9]
MLDGHALFDEQGLQIEIASPSRACIERSVCGLDGAVSIDLGTRTREIRQHGTLHAAGRAAMRVRIDAISAFMDGDTHTLTAASGQEYENIRMDVFEQVAEHVVGSGVLVEYRIVYRQLGV